MSANCGTQRSVEFLSDGLLIQGVLRLPNGDGPYPTVILGHGFAGLKEWTIPEVIDAFIEAGIAGLSFDYRNFGDSQGEPRNEVSHLGRVEDWQNAISYAASLPEVDSRRIGIWGTSLGGRDVLVVAGMDRRVKAVVAQTPLIKWSSLSGASMAGFGNDLERYHQELASDRTNRTLGKEPRYIPWEKDSPSDNSKREYLKSLGEVKLRNYMGRVTLQSYQPTVMTDATHLVRLVAHTPLLFILAEDDFLPGQQEAYEAAKEPKSLVMVKGDHFAPYTTSRQEATLAAKEWFVRYLTQK